MRDYSSGDAADFPTFNDGIFATPGTKIVAKFRAGRPTTNTWTHRTHPLTTPRIPSMPSTPPQAMTLEEFLNSVPHENLTGTGAIQSTFSIPLGPTVPGSTNGIPPNLNISFTALGPATLADVNPTGLLVPSTDPASATVLGDAAAAPTNNSTNANLLAALTQGALFGNNANITAAAQFVSNFLASGDPSTNSNNTANSNLNGLPSVFAPNFPGFPGAASWSSNGNISQTTSPTGLPAVFAPNLPSIPGTTGNDAPNMNSTGPPSVGPANFPLAAWVNLASVPVLPSFTTNNPASLLDFFNNLTTSLGGTASTLATTIPVEPGTSPELTAKILTFEQEMQELRFKHRREYQALCRASHKELAGFEQFHCDTDDFQESIIVQHLKPRTEIELEVAEEWEQEAAAEALEQNQPPGFSLINAMFGGFSDDGEDEEDAGDGQVAEVTAPFAGLVVGAGAAWDAEDMIVDQADFGRRMVRERIWRERMRPMINVPIWRHFASTGVVPGISV